MQNPFLTTVAVALALAVPVVAVQARDEVRAPNMRSTTDRPMNQLPLAQADTIQGSEVRNQNGDRIGNVEHVVVDIKQGQVAYAIVGVGGFLGVGEKSVAVPWNRLKAGDRPESFVLNADRDTLRNAPSVDTRSLAQLEDPQARRQISAFWEQSATQQAQTPEKAPAK